MAHTRPDRSEAEHDLLRRWNRALLLLQLFMAAVVLLMELANSLIFLKTGSMGYTPENWSEMFFRYVLMTTLFDASSILFFLVFIYSTGVREERKKYFLMAPVLLICSNVTFTHHQFSAVLPIFIVPILASILYEHRLFTALTTAASMLCMVPASVVRIRAHSADAITEVLIAYGLILAVGAITYFIAGLMRRRSEALSELAENAAAANRSKGDFLANMSHEIRTPMNAVVGMCELILRERGISDTVREYCYNIQNSGRSLLAIINDILDFSKIESGKMELIEEEFDLASTLNDVINMANTRKGSKRLEIVVHVDPDIPCGLIGDEVRIRQIIVNLVTNAIKYSSEGCVSLFVTHARRDYGINLSVKVSDTGIGIKPEDLEKLFSSFQQVDTKKNRSVEGTGLGLAISKRLIERMGGFIDVKSTYGEGSTFSFVIPLKVSDARPFITVREPESIRAAGYLDPNKYTNRKTRDEYRSLIAELGRELHCRIDLFPTIWKLTEALQAEEWTHVFTAREEYIANSELFNDISRHTQVVVVQERLSAIDLPSGVKCLYKPFYALSVAAVFNNENVLTNLNAHKEAAARFIAPGARVLVVDDNPLNLSVAEGLMRPYRMQVMSADSGPAAITMLRSKDFDLVFMDHMMPGMDGVEATQIIRGMDGDYYRTLPIVALTANAVEGARKMFLSSGFTDFLAKPIEVSALDRVLKNLLPKELMQLRQEDETAEPADGSPADAPDLVENELFSARLGLSYLGGDTGTYLDILSKYAEKGPGKLAEIRALFEAKEWTNYIIEVHALKSTSLTIGAQKLSELARELEMAGKNSYWSLIEEKNGALLELYGQVIDIARQQVEAGRAGQEHEEAQPLTEIGTEELEAYVQQLCAACDGMDVDEIDRICRDASRCSAAGQPLKPLFDRVRAEADDFEYENARAIAGTIAEQVKG